MFNSRISEEKFENFYIQASILLHSPDFLKVWTSNPEGMYFTIEVEHFLKTMTIHLYFTQMEVKKKMFLD